MKWLLALCVFLAVALAGCTMVIQTPTPQPAEEASDEGMGDMNMADSEAMSDTMSSGMAMSGTMMSDEELISNALTAGPEMVVKDAAVANLDAQGTLVTLREATNGNSWTCIPDNSGSPTNDPMCADPTWIKWFTAYVAGEDPDITVPGVAYMLQGESGASNSDPSLMAPIAGTDWITDGPHVMFLLPQALSTTGLTTTHIANGPYIMWSDTPYEHIMVPVAEVAAQSADDPIANAMSAAPDFISKDAAIMEIGADGKLSELRAGTNGWTCIPDNPGSPTDDPICADASWMKWFEAYVSGAEPEITAPGIGYMLQGESGASNEDPSLMEPPAGQDWIVDGPHVMLLLPEPFDQSVFSTEHGMDGPYLMFPGTPYEHMMVPLAMPKEQ
jgi:hypothetical protein